MLEHLSEKFVKKLIDAEIISNMDADVYSYGFFQGIMMLINIMTILLLGMIFKLLIPCILLNFAYIPIRIYAGGHHADSSAKCYVNSTIMIAVLLAIIKWVPIHFALLVLLLIVSSIVIWTLAPVETENNPLDESEKEVFKKRARVILIIEAIIFFISLIFCENWIAQTIALGLFTECIMLIIGYLKSKSV